MSSLQGYNRYEHIVNIGDFHFAQSIDKVIFNITEIGSYKEIFLKMKTVQKIRNDDFEDDMWVLFSETSASTTSIFFDLDMFQSMKSLLKCFTLLGLLEGHDDKYTQFRIKSLKECILHCQGFEVNSNEIIDKFESWLLSKTKPALRRVALVITQFLRFSNLNNKKELFDILDQFPIITSAVRNLPNFKDTLVFDSIINNFQKTWNSYEKLIFYPIVLWWKITLVIPMRVIEFCSLENHCASVSQSGNFLLKVPRKKLRAHKSTEIDVSDTLEVNQEIYELILNYKETIKGYKPTPYLLSYDAYCESSWVTPRAISHKRIKETFTPTQLRLLLKHFYDEIAEKKFGFSNMERINPMDTRHFAFCNMMLQGFNMMTIAHVGGHKSLHSQMHYFSHLEQLSQSSIQYLADQNKFNLENDTFSSLGEREKMIRAKGMFSRYTKEELENLPSLEFGYCTFDPQICPVGDCRYCPHLFIPESQFNDSVICWLNDETDRIHGRIKEQLQLMKSLSCNMTYNCSTFEYDPLAQSELSYLARNSHKLREQKAMVDAKLNFIIERKNYDEK
ncbi:hypothetical protein ACFVS2_07890 [Brevibacillus sp. NPDC058079]|uniref:hypothetical protein n=1 Tax=Brevibacillus sp. NPDC058079 TaxID=3346330 RepID=UPI0036E388C6